MAKFNIDFQILCIYMKKKTCGLSQIESDRNKTIENLINNCLSFFFFLLSKLTLRVFSFYDYRLSFDSKQKKKKKRRSCSYREKERERETECKKNSRLFFFCLFFLSANIE